MDQQRSANRYTAVTYRDIRDSMTSEAPFLCVSHHVGHDVTTLFALHLFYIHSNIRTILLYTLYFFLQVFSTNGFRMVSVFLYYQILVAGGIILCYNRRICIANNQTVMIRWFSRVACVITNSWFWTQYIMKRTIQSMFHSNI